MTSHSWQTNPGHLYTDKGIGSGEFTVFIRVHGDLGSHQAYACKIGGRGEDDIRSLIQMVYPTATHSDIQVNYNYARTLSLRSCKTDFDFMSASSHC